MKWLLKKITGIAIVNFISLLFVVAFVPFQKPQGGQGANSATPTSAPVRNVFSELKSHSVKNDCWISYRGHIYDITLVFGTHPGGDGVMLKYCGNDATSGFDTKDKSPAAAHSVSAINLLQQYLIQ